MDKVHKEQKKYSESWTQKSRPLTSSSSGFSVKTEVKPQVLPLEAVVPSKSVQSLPVEETKSIPIDKPLPKVSNRDSVLPTQKKNDEKAVNKPVATSRGPRSSIKRKSGKKKNNKVMPAPASALDESASRMINTYADEPIVKEELNDEEEKKPLNVVTAIRSEILQHRLFHPLVPPKFTNGTDSYRLMQNEVAAELMIKPNFSCDEEEDDEAEECSGGEDEFPEPLHEADAILPVKKEEDPSTEARPLTKKTFAEAFKLVKEAPLA